MFFSAEVNATCLDSQRLSAVGSFVRPSECARQVMRLAAETPSELPESLLVGSIFTGICSVFSLFLLLHRNDVLECLRYIYIVDFHRSCVVKVFSFLQNLAEKNCCI